MVQSRSFTNLEQLPESNQKPPLRRTASTRSLPGGAAGAKQRPQSVKPADPAGDVKAHARHLKAGRPESSREAGYYAVTTFNVTDHGRESIMKCGKIRSSIAEVCKIGYQSAKYLKRKVLIRILK